MNDELQSLIDGYLDDCLSSEDALRLNALLKSDPEFLSPLCPGDAAARPVTRRVAGRCLARSCLAGALGRIALVAAGVVATREMDVSAALAAIAAVIVMGSFSGTVGPIRLPRQRAWRWIA